MLEEKIYQQIDQYVNNELANEELHAFEQLMSNEKDVADAVKLYKDIPNQLQDLEADLDFNEKLSAARLRHQSTNTQSRNNWLKPLITIIIIGVIAFFIWMQLFQSSTKVNEPVFDENTPIAMWEATEMPSGNFIRGGASDIDQDIYKTAYANFQSEHFTSALETLGQLEATSSIYTDKLLLQGVCEYELGNFDNAIQVYQEYLKQPNVAEDLALWYQAIAYLQNDQIKEARQNLQIIIDNDYSKSKEAIDILKKLPSK